MNETPEVLDVIANSLGIYTDENDDQLLDEILTKIRGLQLNLDKEILRDAERREDAVLELVKVLTIQHETLLHNTRITSALGQARIVEMAVGLYDAMEATLYPGAIEDQPQEPERPKSGQAPAHHIICRYCEGNGFIKFHGVPTTCGKCLGQGFYT